VILQKPVRRRDPVRGCVFPLGMFSTQRERRSVVRPNWSRRPQWLGCRSWLSPKTGEPLRCAGPVIRIALSVALNDRTTDQAHSGWIVRTSEIHAEMLVFRREGDAETLLVLGFGVAEVSAMAGSLVLVPVTYSRTLPDFFRDCNGFVVTSRLSEATAGRRPHRRRPAARPSHAPAGGG